MANSKSCYLINALFFVYTENSCFFFRFLFVFLLYYAKFWYSKNFSKIFLYLSCIHLYSVKNLFCRCFIVFCRCCFLNFFKIKKIFAIDKILFRDRIDFKLFLAMTKSSKNKVLFRKQMVDVNLHEFVLNPFPSWFEEKFFERISFTV